MTRLSTEQEKKILESPPKGTWALMLLLTAGFVVCWLVMYFGFFLAHGPVD
jgi:Cytochrome c oxidase subunit IIa family